MLFSRYTPLIWCLGFITGLSIGPTLSQASVVLLLSSGSTSFDNTLKSSLEGLGHNVTIGAQYGNYTGTDLTGTDVVLLLTNYNWNSFSGMPDSGQTALRNYVNGGGGLVTSEWLVWLIGAGRDFGTLSDVLPVNPTTLYRSAGSATYTEVTPNSVINNGLPTTFSFPLTNIGGTETRITPKAGATVFYGSDYPGGEGLIGWETGSGRVAQFSTLIAAQEINNDNYLRLVSNTLLWAANQNNSSNPVPEPSVCTMWVVLSIAGLGLIRSRRSRERPGW